MHTFLHEQSYKEHGRWQDKLAAQGLKGLIGRDEIIRQIQSANGKSRRGIPASEERKKNQSLALKDKPKSEEHKRNISLSKIGTQLSEETKQKMSLARKGKKHSEETKKKMSLDRRGHIHYRSKAANIYCYDTNELIAENVVIRGWCRQNGYHHSAVHATARGEHKQHKRIYATYI